MSATTTRRVSHTIPPNQAPRTGLHIGPEMASPGAGLSLIDDIRPSDFQELQLALTVVNAYTGGATDPVLEIIVQRKVDYSLPDTDDDSWEDVARFNDIPNSTPTSPVQYQVVTLSQARITSPDALISSLSYLGTNDNMVTAGETRPVFTTDRLRVRENTVQPSGDRTGGVATLTYHLLGSVQESGSLI